MDSIPSIMFLGALLSISAFFSASETALTSANMLRLRNRAEEGEKASRLRSLFQRYDDVLSTVIVGHTLVNIAIVATAILIAIELFGTDRAIIVSIAFITAIILIFGEFVPKSLAKPVAEKFLLRTSAALMILLKICSPITWIFRKLKEKLCNVFGFYKKHPTVTDDDVKMLVEIGEKEGVFLATEKEWLHKVIEFDDIVVKNILTPRLDVVAVAIDTPIEEVKNVFIEEKYSRLPVYDGSIDNIVGVISHRDFFAKYVSKQPFSLREIMRKPYFVNGSTKISHLLEELQKNKVHLAIVLDEFGGTLGIVTMEDIFEEVFGEIFDEHDENEVFIQHLDGGEILLNGRYSLEDFSELVNCELPETSSVTLSGWITDTLGYLPKRGEMLEFDHFKIYIEEVRNRRIQKVILQFSNKQTA